MDVNSVTATNARNQPSISIIHSNYSTSSIQNKFQGPSNDWMSAGSARVYLTICAFMYGSNHISTKVLQDLLPSPLLTFIRFTIASALFSTQMIGYRADPLLIKRSIEIGIW